MIFFNEKKFREIQKILDVENWLLMTTKDRVSIEYPKFGYLLRILPEPKLISRV